MPTSVRLDPGTERLLERLVASGRSRSAVIRDAIRQLVASEPRRTVRASFAARVADSIGILRDADPDLSTETGARFAALLQQRQERTAPSRPARKRSSVPRSTRGRGRRGAR